MIKVTVILILSIQILLLTLLLFSKKEQKAMHRSLGLVLLFFGSATLNFSLTHAFAYYEKYELIPYFQLELLFGLGPAIYIYTKYVTNPKYKIKKQDFLLFLPVVFEIFYYRTPLFRNAITAITQDTKNLESIFFNVQQWSGVLYSSVFMCLSINRFYQYRKWLYENFSSLKERTLEWIHVPILSFVCFWLVWFAIRLSDKYFFGGMYSEVYYFPMFIMLSVITLWIGFKGYTNVKYIPIGFQLRTDSDNRDKGQEDQDLQAIINSISKKMKEEKYYLNQDLNLKLLAEKLSIPKATLSKAINQRLKLNFHEFVNQYRVEEFISRVKNDRKKNFTFLAHAYESGFASKSTFNAVFKKVTNKTPRQFFTAVKK